MKVCQRIFHVGPFHVMSTRVQYDETKSRIIKQRIKYGRVSVYLEIAIKF